MVVRRPPKDAVSEFVPAVRPSVQAPDDATPSFPVDAELLTVDPPPSRVKATVAPTIELPKASAARNVGMVARAEFTTPD
jgi:hypothetical protein